MSPCVRVQHRSAASSGRAQRHDFRRGPQAAHIDPDRMHECDFPLVPPPPKVLWRACVERREESDPKPSRRMRSNAAVTTTYLFTLGAELARRFENLPRGGQNQIFGDLGANMAHWYGTDLVGLAVHRDEATIHAHGHLLAWSREGRPLSSLINQAECRSLQDAACELIADHIPDVERGKPKLDRVADGEPLHKWIHRSARRLRRELPGELEAAEIRLADLNNTIGDRVETLEALGRIEDGPARDFLTRLAKPPGP